MGETKVEVIFYAAMVIIGWGVWLAPAQNIPLKNQQIKTFYVALANLAVAFIVGLNQGLNHLNVQLIIFPFLGGIIWTLGGYVAFVATNRIGMAKAVGIWAPINIIVSIFWGMILFGEFLNSGASEGMKAILAVVVIIIGILLIIFAGTVKRLDKEKRSLDRIGAMAAIGAGVIWGSYFIPIRLAEASLWVTAFPMAIGMFVGSIILVFASKENIKLEKNSYYVRTLLSGALWTLGNYGSLKMMELIGTGKGFTVSQLGIVLTTMIGIFLFKNPDPKTKEAKIAFVGITLAAIGGVVLGNLR